MSLELGHLREPPGLDVFFDDPEAIQIQLNGWLWSIQLYISNISYEVTTSFALYSSSYFDEMPKFTTLLAKTILPSQFFARVK